MSFLESTCACVFCLNAETRQRECGSDSTWDGDNCSCDLIPIPTTATTEATTVSTTLPPAQSPEPCIENPSSVSPNGTTPSTVSTTPYTGSSTAATTTTPGPFFNLAGPMDFGAVFKIVLEILEDVSNDAFGGMSFEQIVTSLLSGLPGTCNNTP